MLRVQVPAAAMGVWEGNVMECWAKTAVSHTQYGESGWHLAGGGV